MYSEIVTDHAINPRNRGVLEDADAQGSARYQRCGDKMTLYFKVEGGLVTDCRFVAFGCGPAVAAASLFTTLARGHPVDQVRCINAFDINQALGGLPASKRHAILMVLQCLGEALGGRP